MISMKFASVRALIGHIPQLAQVLDLRAARRARCDVRMLAAYKLGDFQKVEDYLLDLLRIQAASTWAITFYIGKIVHAGKACRLSEILSSAFVRDDHRQLLLSAYYRVNGEYKKAIEALSYGSSSSLVRYKTAQAERSLYHQLQDWEGKALAAIRYIKNEPNRILLEFALHAAGSAENADREDLVRIALGRAVRDMRKVKASNKLIRKHWKEAVLVSRHVFDIPGAISICEKAAAMGIKGASSELRRLRDLNRESEPIRRLLGAAYRSMRVRAGELPPIEDKADVCIVVHAAAFRENKIDYPGFRQDIRYCYEAILRSLEARNITFSVRGKLLVHGKVREDRPYFSYHTIADDHLGLHFKETDRPGSFSFDARGYSGWSSLADSSLSELGLQKIDGSIAREFFINDAERVITGGVSKYHQSADIDSGLPSRFILIALQIVGDAVQSLAYMSALEMINEVLPAADRMGIPVVIKRHPYCKSAHLKNFIDDGSSEGRFYVASGNIHKLIQRSVGVCVVNSAVGSEALLHQKPVYVFGKSEYMAACYICRKPGDFSRQFKPDIPKLSSDDLYRFWYYLKNRFSIDLRQRDQAQNRIDAIVEEHLLRARTPV